MLPKESRKMNLIKAAVKLTNLDKGSGTTESPYIEKLLI